MLYLVVGLLHGESVDVEVYVGRQPFLSLVHTFVRNLRSQEGPKNKSASHKDIFPIKTFEKMVGHRVPISGESLLRRVDEEIGTYFFS